MAIQSAINQSLAVAAGAVALGKHAAKEAEEAKAKQSEAEKNKKADAIARKQAIADTKEAIAKKGLEIEDVNRQISLAEQDYNLQKEKDGPETERFQIAMKRLKQLRTAKKAQQTAFRAKIKMLKEVDNG